ncbi:13011_t:CDS:2 [Funneliformis mosseae]|uniref:13011_t:CDS:1 n=1 Tax=Funneliformis mosseae TaxID=27381 RepID=A0A9N9AA31_FUNMO|nr:13011_t:CDS:2 [Funneliformis mosseae]
MPRLFYTRPTPNNLTNLQTLPTGVVYYGYGYEEIGDQRVTLSLPRNQLSGDDQSRQIGN